MFNLVGHYLRVKICFADTWWWDCLNWADTVWLLLVAYDVLTKITHFNWPPRSARTCTFLCSHCYGSVNQLQQGACQVWAVAMPIKFIQTKLLYSQSWINKKYRFTFSNSKRKRIIGNHKSLENFVHMFSSDVLFYVRADSVRQFWT